MPTPHKAANGIRGMDVIGAMRERCQITGMAGTGGLGVRRWIRSDMDAFPADDIGGFVLARKRKMCLSGLRMKCRQAFPSLPGHWYLHIYSADVIRYHG